MLTIYCTSYKVQGFIRVKAKLFVVIILVNQILCSTFSNTIAVCFRTHARARYLCRHVELKVMCTCHLIVDDILNWNWYGWIYYYVPTCTFEGSIVIELLQFCLLLQIPITCTTNNVNKKELKLSVYYVCKHQSKHICNLGQVYYYRGHV